MVIKRPVFECKGLARWYTIIDGEFFYWSLYHQAWVQSCNDQGLNIRRMSKAMTEKRVHIVMIRGKVIPRD